MSLVCEIRLKSFVRTYVARNDRLHRLIGILLVTIDYDDIKLSL